MSMATLILFILNEVSDAVRAFSQEIQLDP